MKLTDLSTKLEGLNSSRIGAILDLVNSGLKSTLTGQQENGGVVPIATVARLLLMYAMSISDDKHISSGSKSANAPQWTSVVKEIQDFVDILSVKIQKYCCNTYSKDQISQFATLASRHQGANTNYFYSTLVLFLGHLAEQGRFDRKYIQLITPDQDLKILDEIFPRVIKIVNRETLFEDDPDSKLETAPEEKVFESLVRFEIKQSLNENLTSFIDHYRSGEKSVAHLVLYRSTKSDPTKLMKTFLTISPPRDLDDGGANNSAFNHFYIAPGETRPNHLRYSGGKVLPLDHGVYLVGGQRSYNPKKRMPFSSVKVIAFEWLDINNQHPLMSAILMSTNYRGNMIVSRAAARVTPFVHHLDIGSSAISISELQEDLTQDYEKELAYVTGAKSDSQNQHWTGGTADNFLIDLDKRKVGKAAEFIITNTNNNPRGNKSWNVGVGYKRTSNESLETLSNTKLESAIEEGLLGDRNSPFVDDSEQQYNLWSSTRFGPLGSDPNS